MQRSTRRGASLPKIVSPSTMSFRRESEISRTAYRRMPDVARTILFSYLSEAAASSPGGACHEQNWPSTKEERRARGVLLDGISTMDFATATRISPYAASEEEEDGDSPSSSSLHRGPFFLLNARVIAVLLCSTKEGIFSLEPFRLSISCNDATMHPMKSSDLPASVLDFIILHSSPDNDVEPADGPDLPLPQYRAARYSKICGTTVSQGTSEKRDGSARSRDLR
mmetsp:Transcript_18252/g.43927  ORF Transcript_18252/g.43927 Transcript_18252/m.43927 type:complete len:225 (-) Transcript_18252:2373-3047(-)